MISIIPEKELRQCCIVLPEEHAVMDPEILIQPVERFFGRKYFQQYYRFDKRSRVLMLSTSSPDIITGSYATGKDFLHAIDWKNLKGCSGVGMYNDPNSTWVEPDIFRTKYDTKEKI